MCTSKVGRMHTRQRASTCGHVKGICMLPWSLKIISRGGEMEENERKKDQDAHLCRKRIHAGSAAAPKPAVWNIAQTVQTHVRDSHGMQSLSQF